MKKIDLNLDIEPIVLTKEIKLKNGETKKAEETIPSATIILNSIKSVVSRSLNGTDPITNKFTKGVSLEDNYQYYVITNKIKTSESHIVELDNDEYKWLKINFSIGVGTLSLQDDINDTLVKISMALSKAELQ